MIGTQRTSTFSIPLKVFFFLVGIPLVLLLVGGEGLVIHYTREIMAENSRTYGQYKATEEIREKGEDLRTAIWRLATAPPWRSGTQLWEESREDIRTLALQNARLEPHAKALTEKLTALEAIRKRQAELEAIRDQGVDGKDFIDKKNALANESDSILRSLPELVMAFEKGSNVTNEMGDQLRKTVIKAQDAENIVLILLVLAGVYMTILVIIISKEVVRPLIQIKSYVAQLGTGVAVPEPAKSCVLGISDIADGLENLAVYLGKATVRSEKIETERSRFRRMSLFDGLTNLYNRRAFDDMLKKLWDNSLTARTHLGLVMMDVDKFKVYNDSLGHQEGDVCLKKVAEAVAHAVRDGDVAARYGGEEFVVILPSADREKAYNAAERIRKAVESIKLPHPGSPAGPYVTVSLGIEAMVPQNEFNETILVRHADEALYFSKENGRNRATLYTGDGTSGTV
ncbi:MAG: GGDEF domain-containing protein [Desulfovibrio sp.]|nr:GGDEF domain-containing protein [Desulfovibrio sp.]